MFVFHTWARSATPDDILRTYLKNQKQLKWRSDREGVSLCVSSADATATDWLHESAVSARKKSAPASHLASSHRSLCLFLLPPAGGAVALASTTIHKLWLIVWCGVQILPRMCHGVVFPFSDSLSNASNFVYQTDQFPVQQNRKQLPVHDVCSPHRRLGSLYPVHSVGKRRAFEIHKKRCNSAFFVV